jgi:glycosyltransferase involved in cell wall biosynthesis
MVSGFMDTRCAVDDPLVVLIPTFNDWIALDMLLVEVDKVLTENRLHASVLIVDDGSTFDPGEAFKGRDYQSLQHIDMLALRRNLGHQRAISIGLAYAEKEGTCQSIIVMDSDGEDDPRDIPRLLEKLRNENHRKIVFAERTRRSESRSFRFFYTLYKTLHWLLTGIRVRVGNYSVIPRCRLASLVVVSDLWNHYAAAVFKSRQLYCTIPTRRAKRLHGKSTMNFVSLVVHGLSAISVYSETVGVRLLVVAALLTLGASAGIAVTIGIRVLTGLAVPGWASNVVGILFVILVLSFVLSLHFSFIVLSDRHGFSFLPRRDYVHFISEIRKLI